MVPPFRSSRSVARLCLDKFVLIRGRCAISSAFSSLQYHPQWHLGIMCIATTSSGRLNGNGMYLNRR